jgi:hypothetical protein
MSIAVIDNSKYPMVVAEYWNKPYTTSPELRPMCMLEKPSVVKIFFDTFNSECAEDRNET